MGLNGVINETAFPLNLAEFSVGNNVISGTIPSQWPAGLTLINLGTNQLTGGLPSSFPSGLDVLYLDQNHLTGHIPNALPNELKNLNLQNNAITGSIPNDLPSGLVFLYLWGNLMSGDLPSLPYSLQYLVLGYPGYSGNHFTGTLRLNRPLYLVINNNWITDVVIQDSSGLTLGCELSNNSLLGNPNIANLTMCTQNGLYSAKLLPVTKSATATAIITTANLIRTSTQLKPTVMSTLTVLDVTSTENSPGTTKDISEITTVIMTVKSIHTSTLGRTSIGTVQFVQELSRFSFNLNMVLRIAVDVMMLVKLLNKTPFKRELKKMLKKGNTKTSKTGGWEYK